ncbi:MAG: polyphosphate polymerase domain-containing protein [Gammaproteobacteria bacterium]|nr:polyphosphate polymerase domain-containing protein [Gammaproteobacteria bacterium]
MRQVPELARLEIKFAAYQVHLRRLEQWLQHHWAGFYIPYPDRQVNNVYFDTHNYAAFQENLSGGSARTKVRYRWYGQSIAPDAGVLEVKCKRNYFGWKLRYPVAKAPYKEGASWRWIHQSLIEQIADTATVADSEEFGVPIVSNDGSKWLHANPMPVMINRYQRKYFVSADDKIRATIDVNQEVWDQRYKPRPNFRYHSIPADNLVLEIKFDRKDRELASEVIQGLPVRVSRHSKYVNGVRAIQGWSMHGS